MQWCFNLHFFWKPLPVAQKDRTPTILEAFLTKNTCLYLVLSFDFFIIVKAALMHLLRIISVAKIGELDSQFGELQFSVSADYCSLHISCQVFSKIAHKKEGTFWISVVLAAKFVCILQGARCWQSVWDVDISVHPSMLTHDGFSLIFGSTIAKPQFLLRFTGGPNFLQL